MLGQKSARPGEFIDALLTLQKVCDVDCIKLSDYGIKPSDFERIADNARDTMGGLFALDPRELTKDEIVAIYTESYK